MKISGRGMYISAHLIRDPLTRFILKFMDKHIGAHELVSVYRPALPHVGMQFDLEDKTAGSNSQENEIVLFCPPT